MLHSFQTYLQVMTGSSVLEKFNLLRIYLDKTAQSFRFDYDILSWFHWDVASDEKYIKFKPYLKELTLDRFSNREIAGLKGFIRIPLFQAFGVLYDLLQKGEILLYSEEPFSLSIELTTINKKGNQTFLWWYSWRGRAQLIVRDEHRIWEKGHTVLFDEEKMLEVRDE